MKFPKIVLTGGPGAGKTAVLEMARRSLSEKVALLPESASIIFGGGFWRLESPTARKAAQRAIFHVQREMESLVEAEGKWKAAICDRGTLDGLAYWMGSEAQYVELLGCPIEEELSKYSAVIHLRTPPLQLGYNKSNPLRTESSAEAQQIDEKIASIWRKHPRYAEVPSTESFLLKAELAVRQIVSALPENCRECF